MGGNGAPVRRYICRVERSANVVSGWIEVTHVVAVKQVDGGIALDLLHDGKRFTEVNDYVIIAIGKAVDLSIYPVAVIGKDGPEIIDDTGCSTLPGLYFAGDVRRQKYRQISIAIGDAMVATMGMAKYIRGLNSSMSVNG